jgi:hypothetical protein
LSEEQPDIAERAILAVFDRGTNVRLDRFEQSSKQRSPIVSTDGGMWIDCNEEQEANAAPLNNRSFEYDSNVTVESAAHNRKHFAPSVSTLAGMQIDGRERQPSNAQSLIIESFEGASNRISARMR